MLSCAEQDIYNENDILQRAMSLFTKMKREWESCPNFCYNKDFKLKIALNTL